MTETRPEAARLHDRTTRFNGFVLRTRPFSLSKGGRPIDTPRQSLELLDHLIACRDRVVTREELVAKFWSIEHLGADQNLNTCVRRLRKALADGGGGDLVETHARIGYRFVGDIDEGAPATMQRPSRVGLMSGVAAGFALVAACAWAAPAAWSLYVTPEPRARSQIARIAVPPGRNMCDTTLFPMFIDGLRENLITDLKASAGDEVSFLKVGSRQAAETTAASYVLDLGVRQMPDRTIANLSLVSAVDGEVLWTRQIAEPTDMNNYLATQERLASQLANAFAERDL